MIKSIKLLLTGVVVFSFSDANASWNIIDNGSVNFYVHGNAELNINYQDRESNEHNNAEFNQDGRVLIEFHGSKYTNSGNYVIVKAQPLFGTTGNVSLDDAYFEFGKKDSWVIKAGRFEAYDMFPVGLDVFLDYSGDTSNDLYSGDSAYLYQMKEARGRGSDGQLMYSQHFGELYIELSTMIGDRSNLFADTYHGVSVDHDNSKDSFLVRPVLAYSIEGVTVAVSMETNLVNDAVVDEQGKDISERLGYGLTGNWTDGNLNMNANFAYMDAIEETNLTLGLNVRYNSIGIGYIYGANEYDSNWANGNVGINTAYASYEIGNILEIEKFSVLLGTYYTAIENKTDNKIAFAEDDDFGARLRLFYEF